jgi:hypothetical protein
VGLPEFSDVLFGNILDILGIEEKAQSQFQLHLGLAVFEVLLSYPGDVEFIVEDSVGQLLTVPLRPVESLFGIEVGMVEGVVLVADLRARESSPHEFRVPLVIYLRAFHHR